MKASQSRAIRRMGSSNKHQGILEYHGTFRFDSTRVLREDDTGMPTQIIRSSCNAGEQFMSMFDDYDQKLEDANNNKKKRKSIKVQDVRKDERVSDTTGSDRWTDSEQQQDERDVASDSSRDELDDIFRQMPQNAVRDEKKKKARQSDMKKKQSDFAKKRALVDADGQAYSLDHEEQVRLERKRFMASKAEVFLKREEIRNGGNSVSGKKAQEMESADMEEFLKIRREIQAFGTTCSQFVVFCVEQVHEN